MKPINRRSFFVRLAGFLALFFVSPVKAVAPEPVFNISAGSAIVDGAYVEFPAFEKATLRAISAAHQVPYELLIRDLSKTSYSSARTTWTHNR